MSSKDGAKSQIRAAIDTDGVKSDDFVGPLLGALGPPVNVGTSVRNIYNWFWPVGFSDVDVERLMQYSEEATGVKF